MFWNLLLAHLLGDFVFQTDWMVKKRDNLWVLAWHASIHFVLMLFFAGQVRSVIWPFLLVLAIMHFLQDRIKINITNKRTDWVSKGFIIDQGIHYVIIWSVVYLFKNTTGSVEVAQKPSWVLVAIAYVCVSYVWFIIERIFNLSNLDYLQNINATKFSRMLSRTGLISLFLLLRTWTTAGMAIGFSNPYPQSEFRQKAMLTDISVSLIAMVFLVWALG